MQFWEELLDERTLMTRKGSGKKGTMPIPGSEGAARKDVAHAGFRRKGPIQEPKVEKSGSDVPVWVRSHKSPAEYAAHTAKKKHKEGEKTNVKALRKQFKQTGAEKDSEVHDITVGSPKSKVKEPGQRARQFVGALKNVAAKMKEKRGVATNTPTAISSSGKKRKRSDEEGAEQRGRIYNKLGMGERNPKTGVQMAKLKEGKTFQQFMLECYSIDEATINKQIRNTRERDTALISRDRGSQSEKENRRERKSFEKTLKRSGHGFSKNVGSYDEGEGKGMSTEVSYQVTRNPKKNSKRGFERKMRNLGNKKGPSGEAQHSVITQRANKDAKLVSTDGSGEKPFSIGKAKHGNNPDPTIGQTTAGKVRSGKKPNSQQTEKNVKQNRSFHYSNEG